VKLVGTDKSRIIDAVELLLSSEHAYRAMASASNPFGDGRAAGRIVDIIKRELL
jgi:UDP-N-acetylglucosamine 2-epimerase (non-hydrolysing)